MQKYLAQCGVGSRRGCEQWIADGRVQVNGQVQTQQGCCIDPDRDRVLFDGRPVRPETREYILFNKPRDVLCTCRDPGERRTFREFVPDPEHRLFPVGRLDRNSEGLLILTNDGDFAQALIHPRHQVPKYYEVWVDARLTEAECRRLVEGVEEGGEWLQAAEVMVVGKGVHRHGYGITLFSGRNRQIRRMIAALGHEVIALKRVGIGSLTAEGLRVGQWRRLTSGEVSDLMGPANRLRNQELKRGGGGRNDRPPSAPRKEATDENGRNGLEHRGRHVVRGDRRGRRVPGEGDRRSGQFAGASRVRE